MSCGCAASLTASGPGGVNPDAGYVFRALQHRRRDFTYTAAAPPASPAPRMQRRRRRAADLPRMSRCRVRAPGPQGRSSPRRPPTSSGAPSRTPRCRPRTRPQRGRPPRRRDGRRPCRGGDRAAPPAASARGRDAMRLLSCRRWDFLMTPRRESTQFSRKR